MSRIERALHAVVTTALLFACAVALGAPALFYRSFLDENATVETAVNFLTRLQYTFLPDRPHFGAFEPEMSIGIVSSLPAGVGWLVRGDLLGARIAVAAYCLLLAASLAYACIRIAAPQLRAYALPLALLCCWVAFTVVPGVPHVIVVSMGEFSGAVILGLGWILLPFSPALGAFVLGLCVWHAKVIYAPFALLALLVSAASAVNTLRARARLLAVELAAFVFPLVAWVLLVWLRTGNWGLLEWVTRRARFFGVGHYSNLDVTTRAAANLATRLVSPAMEWSHYGIMVKLKVVTLLLGPVLLLLAQVGRHWWSRTRDWPRDLLQLGLATGIFAGAWWYFFRHGFMWLRHVMPFMLVGFGVLVYFALVYGARLRPRRQLIIAALVAMAVAADGLIEWHAMHLSVAGMPADHVFARRCRSDGRRPGGPWRRGVCWEQYKRPPGQPVDLSPGERSS